MTHLIYKGHFLGAILVPRGATLVNSDKWLSDVRRTIHTAVCSFPERDYDVDRMLLTYSLVLFPTQPGESTTDAMRLFYDESREDFIVKDSLLAVPFELQEVGHMKYSVPASAYAVLEDIQNFFEHVIWER